MKKIFKSFCGFIDSLYICIVACAIIVYAHYKNRRALNQTM